MLLDLCLQVCRIFVALVRCSLELFIDPGLELVGVSPEVLEPARFLQLLPLDLRGLLELDIPSEDLDIDKTSNLIKAVVIGIFVENQFPQKIPAPFHYQFSLSLFSTIFEQ